MFRTTVLLLLLSILNHNVSGYSFKAKCGISDGECQRAYYTSIIQLAAESGIPDLGIPILDPYAVKNLETTVMGLIKVTILEGNVEGLKTCQAKNFNIDMEKLTSSVVFTCEVVNIKGKYNLETTDGMKALIGGINVNGKGVASITIENIQINLEIPFEIKKIGDGEIHGAIDYKKIVYTYEVLGNAKIILDNLYVGSQDISAVAVNIFNENWKFLTNIFGRPFLDLGMQVFGENANKFLTAVPLKEIVSDDLSVYS